MKIPSPEFDALTQRARLGSTAALTAVFDLGETAKAEGRLQDAVEAYREGLIAYRIVAGEYASQARESRRVDDWPQRVLKIHQDWIAQNPRGFRALPIAAPGLDYEAVRKVVVDQLKKDEAYADLFRYLDEELSKLGIEFYGPGGSIQRYVTVLLVELFGIQPMGMFKYLAHATVRIGLDQFADEVLRRSKRGRGGKPSKAGPRAGPGKQTAGRPVKPTRRARPKR